ncbi:uncharacterized protein L3040_003542 [Drepanopeziza brunnea f. sp. 'multigermtubi']|uniref:Uncharacterized protein n=1 Tax=Marssonina brunnea f. sp. multigermtubi (strain MB_m1) TaxID=1072389 RepID=K1WX93_MARBU|nr:uncharacterized protein MBM_04030 [Drepanopeziza brunnea f. sp. 'multigermtubi' MB_m1]EKD17661.1 hypothetical protein MBM_04030 [Drepanopeziza brunnea f. sp. 'multigermtubi' MB_m1]KAJ5046295.1 hypothetical protein L3040_003542 [Drepanopeziza brunnea f. sp. 'multigermtubi']
MPPQATFEDEEKRLLTDDNYYLWKSSVIKKLMEKSVSQHVLEEAPLPRPQTASEDQTWDDDRKEALSIIVSHLSEHTCAQYMDIALQNDPRALWEAIASNQGAMIHSAGMQDNLETQLLSEKYTPSVENADAYLHRLRALQARLRAYPGCPSDVRLKNIFIKGLPNSGFWPVIKMRLRSLDQTLQDTFVALKVLEAQHATELQTVKTAPVPEDSLVAEVKELKKLVEANMARGDHKGRRGGRGRGKGRRRGGIHKGGRGKSAETGR